MFQGRYCASPETSKLRFSCFTFKNTLANNTNREESRKWLTNTRFCKWNSIIVFRVRRAIFIFIFFIILDIFFSLILDLCRFLFLMLLIMIMNISISISYFLIFIGYFLIFISMLIFCFQFLKPNQGFLYLTWNSRENTPIQWVIPSKLT